MKDVGIPLSIVLDNILEISKLVHEAGGLLYYDGANMNAIMGYTNPKLMGFDVVHLNLHKKWKKIKKTRLIGYISVTWNTLFIDI